MKLFDNAYHIIFDELKTWYAVDYHEVYDMVQLWRAWDKVFTGVQSGIILAVDNNFVRHADAQTVTRLEQFLGIVHTAVLTLEERREAILAFIAGQGKIGRPEIKVILSAFIQGEIDVEFDAGVITITVTRSPNESAMHDEIHRALDWRIPAHLALRSADVEIIEPIKTTVFVAGYGWRMSVT
jgi:hypothetical protein